jgi:hypothetical protein
VTFIRKLLGEPSPQDLLARANLEYVRGTSGKPISETMMVWLALVIFDGYEIGGNGDGSQPD